MPFHWSADTLRVRVSISIGRGGPPFDLTGAVFVAAVGPAVGDDGLEVLGAATVFGPPANGVVDVVWAANSILPGRVVAQLRVTSASVTSTVWVGQYTVLQSALP